MDNTSISPEIYTDFQGLQKLKRAAREDARGATKEVAQQFESLFVKMMLKSMRDASFGDEMFGSQQMDAYQDMFDNQMAIHLSKGKGIGLSEVIIRQLNGVNQKDVNQSDNTENGSKAVFALSGDGKNTENRTVQDFLYLSKVVAPNREKTVSEDKITKNQFNSPTEFVETLWPLAKKMSEKSGISPQILLAQAALETGWGKAVSKHASGKSSFNLFNIKADHRWDGERVAKTTLEYKDGVADKQKANFRSYHSFEESFQDFINFISNEPRYQNAMQVVDNNKDFITELHKSGYATDPLYAEKVIRVLKGPEMKNALLRMF